MTRCKYCHTDHELDSKGRCPSCADAGDATRAGGPHPPPDTRGPHPPPERLLRQWPAALMAV